MSYTLDQTTDYSFRELHTFLDGISTPEFVKQAEMDTKETVEKLSEEAFADRYNRAYPIHTPAATYLSHAHFTQKKAELSKKWGVGYVEEVAARIKTAGELHKIASDLSGYEKQAAEKAAVTPEEKCVFTVKVGEADTGLFPYRTKEDLSKQAEEFAANISNYPFDWRRPIAVSFWKQASEVNLEELPELICKYAGMYFPDTSSFADELTRRMNKLSDDKQADYAKLIEKAASAVSAEDFYELCGEAYEAEKQAGAWDHAITRRTLGDIVDTTFTLSIDKVASLLNVVDMAGEPYCINELKKVSKDIYKEAFGADLDPSNGDQLRDVLPTMPLSDVALFRELSGINPLS